MRQAAPRAAARPASAARGVCSLAAGSRRGAGLWRGGPKLRARGLSSLRASAGRQTLELDRLACSSHMAALQNKGLSKIYPTVGREVQRPPGEVARGAEMRERWALGNWGTCTAHAVLLRSAGWTGPAGCAHAHCHPPLSVTLQGVRVLSAAMCCGPHAEPAGDAAWLCGLAQGEGYTGRPTCGP